MRAFWCWLALAAAGQIAALHLIDAGPRLHYQHYFRIGEWLTGTRAVAAAVLVAQLLVVAAAMARRGSSMLGRLREHFGGWRLAAVLALVVVTGVALSPRPGAWLSEMAIAAVVQTVNLANIALAMQAVPEWRWKVWRGALDRWLGARSQAVEPARGIDRWTAVGAVLVTLTAACLSYFVYENHPHITDEVIYVMQADYVAAGHLTLPAPPVPAAFHIYLRMTDHGRWFSPVPPGWPMVLSVGALLGVRWLVNPILAGLNVWLAWLLMREVYPRRTSRLVILLLCASPWVIFMSMNFMTHTLLFTMAVAALLGVARARRTGHSRWAWLAGAATGFASLIRPLDGAIVGMMAGLWSIGLGGKRLSFRNLVALGVGTLVLGSLALPYNAYLTGDPLKNPIMEYTDREFHPGANSLGFGPNRGMGWALDAYPGHTPFEAGLNALLNGFSLNTELHGWSAGSLWAVALALVACWKMRADRAAIAAVATVVAAYGLYYYSGGPEFGARYWYAALLPLLVLSVRGLERLEEMTRSEAPVAGALLLTLMAVCIYLPWRAVNKYRNFLGMRTDVRKLAEQRHFGRSLVLIRGLSHPDYASAAVYNPLDLSPKSRENVPIYVWDRDAATRAKVLAVYADRPVWVLDGPTRTGAGYRIVQSPDVRARR